MSSCDLDIWPLLIFCGTSGVMCLDFAQSWAISNKPRLTYRRLSTFSRAILGGGSQLTELSHGSWTQLHQTWPGHRAIIAALSSFVSEFRLSCCIFKRGRLKVERSFTRRQISHFLTHSPVKIRGGVGEITIPIVKADLRPNLQNGHPLRGCWARWIDKKRKKKVHG